MMALILKIKLFFSSPIGILTGLLIKNAANVFIKDILDSDFQKKAYEFVIDLNKSDLPNLEKARIFNAKMIEYARSKHREIANSVINCLREFAVNAVKSSNLLSESEELSS